MSEARYYFLNSVTDRVISLIAMILSLIYLARGSTLVAIYWLLFVIAAVIPPRKRPWIAWGKETDDETDD